MFIIYYKDNGRVFDISSTEPENLAKEMDVIEVEDTTDITTDSSDFYYVDKTDGQLKFKIEEYRQHKLNLLRYYRKNKHKEGYYSETFDNTFPCQRENLDDYTKLIRWMRTNNIATFDISLYEDGKTLTMTADEIETLLNEIIEYGVITFNETKTKYLAILNAKTKKDLDDII